MSPILPVSSANNPLGITYALWIMNNTGDPAFFAYDGRRKLSAAKQSLRALAEADAL